MAPSLRAAIAVASIHFLSWACSAHAAIITTGNVTPDPNTTTSSTTLYVGNTANGTMQINGGSSVTAGSTYLGYTSSAFGSATVTDSGSKLTYSFLTVGQDGDGQLTISNGATASGSFASLGDSETGYGTATVTGGGSTWTNTFLDIGFRGQGSLTVSDGGKVTGSSVDVGNFDGYGVATVTGPGSSVNMTSSVSIDNGQLNIQNGGTVTGSTSSIGNFSSDVGTATVTGANSRWTANGDLSVGSSGTGTLSIDQAGVVEVSRDTWVGRFSMGAGVVNFDNGTLQTGGLLTRLSDLRGTGTIYTHGLVTDIDLVFNTNNAFQQQIALNGTNQNILIDLDVSGAGSLGAGFRGQGSLTIADGLHASSLNGYLGYHTNSSGTATVSGVGTSWTMSGGLTVGSSGTGTLAVTGGASVEVGQTTSVGTNSSISLDNGTLTTRSLLIGANQLAGTGTINTRGLVSDLALVFDQTHPLQQQLLFNSQPNQNVVVNLNVDGSGSLGGGYRGVGTLMIADGVNVVSSAGFLGYNSPAVGTATVTGAGTKWTINGQLTVGQGGTGILNITGGATVSNMGGAVNKGKVTVSGNDSTWTNSSSLSIGGIFTGPAELLVSNGGKVTSTSTSQSALTGTGIGAQTSSTGKVTVEGPGSNWTHTGSLTVGGDGTGTLIVSAGGTVVSSGGALGSGFGFSGSGTATISGAGSTWTNNGSLVVGGDKPATLTISDGGTVTSTSGALGTGFNASSSATLTGQSSAWTMTGGLTVGEFSGGTATLAIRPGSTVQVGGETLISSTGRLNLEGGMLTTNLLRFQSFGGQFNWTSGTLHVGTYFGNLTNSAGVMSPGQSPGSSAINGNYVQQSAGMLQMEIGGTTSITQHDVITVSGNTTLGGNLQLNLLSGFVPGALDTFTILTTGGTLSGAFTNVPNGQRLATANGIGSFLVSYGSTSAFNPKHVVLSGFQLTVPEPTAQLFVAAPLIVALMKRRRRS